MYVCMCAGVTDLQIIEAAKGASSADNLAAELGVGENCGSCLDYFYELAMGEGLPLVALESPIAAPAGTKEVVFDRVLISA